MKIVIWTVIAIVAGYLYISQSDKQRKREAEQARLAAAQSEMDSSRLESERLEKDLAKREKETARIVREITDEANRAASAAKEKAELPAAETAPILDTPIQPQNVESQSSAFKEHADKLFVVKAGPSSGSGFICDIGGKVVALTNAHVISGAKQLSFLKPDGTNVVVAVEQMQVAMDRDLAFFPLKTPQAALKIAAATEADIGDEIVCLGNSDGKSVITHLPGKILGVGPDSIEVDAQVVQGNSGSPVLNMKTGEVLGVVTKISFGEKNIINEGTRFAEARRLCLKVEGAKWKPVGWATFAAEAAMIATYRNHRENLQSLVDALDAGLLDHEGYQNCSLAIRGAVRTFITALTNPKLARAELLKAQAAFLREVIFEVKKGPFDEIEVLKQKSLSMCDYHRKALVEEIRNHEEMARKVAAKEGGNIAVAGAATAPETPARRPASVPPRNPAR